MIIFSNTAVQVLVQECIRYNKLIDIMEQSLPELQKALKGLVVMSGELEAVGKAIALNAVPESWEAKVNPSVLGRVTFDFVSCSLSLESDPSWSDACWVLDMLVFLPGRNSERNGRNSVARKTSAC